MENNELNIKQLLPKAIIVLNENLEKDYCTISWMQRMLQVGYSKSWDLINLLQKQGFIEEPDLYGKRKILKRN